MEAPQKLKAYYAYKMQRSSMIKDIIQDSYTL